MKCFISILFLFSFAARAEDRVPKKTLIFKVGASKGTFIQENGSASGDEDNAVPVPPSDDEDDDTLDDPSSPGLDQIEDAEERF